MNVRWNRVHAEISEMDLVRRDFLPRLVPGDWLRVTRLLQGTAGLTADYTAECMDLLRSFDQCEHDPALTVD